METTLEAQTGQLWNKTFPQPATDPAKEVCCICQHATAREGLLSYNRDKVCAFCATYFTPDAVPELPRIKTRIEVLGAWAKFADDLGQWETNVFNHLRCHRLAVEDGLPEALRLWAGGSLIDDGKQSEVLGELWPLLALERVMARLEVAITLAHEFELGADTYDVTGAITRPEVLPVWELWLRANAIARP